MKELWQKLASLVLWWRGAKPKSTGTPSFICRCEIVWEAMGRRGQGQIRELSSTSLRLRTDRPILAGSSIRIQPKVETLDSLAFDVAWGTVVYCRSRADGMEVGVRLVTPEQISRFGWLHQLQHPSGVPRVGPSTGSLPKLRVVSSHEDR